MAKKKIKFVDYIDVFLVILIVLIMGVLGSLRVLERIEYSGYDFLLHIKPKTSQNPNIMLSNIDDYALEEVGTWPWTRDIVANCLVRMREFGVDTIVFDIEYLSDSQRGVDMTALDNLPEKFNSSLENTAELFDEFSISISRGQIPASMATSISNDLINDYLIPNYEDLYNSVAGDLIVDNDEIFGKSIRYFGNTWLTIGIADIHVKTDDEYKDFIYKNILQYNVSDPDNNVEKFNDRYYKSITLQKGFSPSIYKLMQHAKGAGFTNVVIDKDGSRRRIELLHKNDDAYIPQLAFGPLLSILDTRTIEVKKQKMIIKNALIPGNEKREDISIPLDSGGQMLINWIPEKFSNSFKNDTIYWVIYIDEIEDNLISNLKTLESVKIRDATGMWLPYYSAVSYLLNEYDDLKKQKAAIFNDPTVERNDPRFEKLFSDRALFFKDIEELFDPMYIDSLFARLDELTNDANKADMDANKEAITLIFDTIKSNLDLYNSEFSKLKNLYNGTYCIIGNSAQGSTDLGTTPFERSYPNVGTHANIMNTILTKRFIRPVSWLVMYIISALLSFGLLFFRNSSTTRFVNIYGLTTVVMIPLISVMMIGIALIYLPVIVAIFTFYISFLTIFIRNFVMANKDKKFITNAFGQCLSPAVVDEIVANPDSFKLGGEKVEMSAIFTDIQKFSSFSELLTASQLVALLNYYLTKMSDIIMAERGTVDKYEGDAIVAFIGAPLNTPDHATRTVRAALKMKSEEIKMNKEIIEVASKEKSPEMEQDLYDAFCIMVKNKKNVFTRIGINSGEMIAGYMGSEGKKNYTMMGNNVNLASRLEGVNKQYSTDGILISQSTHDLLDDSFILRRLDRVRVVNVNTPIRLYEPMCEKRGASEDVFKYVELWDKAMDLFEERKYEEALKLFKKLSSARPSDNVAKYYIGLIENFFIKGKYPVEADGIGVEFNAEDGVFKLLQK